MTRREDPALLGSPRYERLAADRYFTEPWVGRALIDCVQFRGWIWEPAAGRGDLVNVLTGAGYRVIATDLSGASLGCTIATPADFLSAVPPDVGEFSIATNPPYLKQMPARFIRHALR
jgi:hypothetical protein